MKKFKINQEVWGLIINEKNFSISFAIEKVLYLGELEKKYRLNDKHIHGVEHYNDKINYFAIDDIFKTKKEAGKYLISILIKMDRLV